MDTRIIYCSRLQLRLKPFVKLYAPDQTAFLDRRRETPPINYKLSGSLSVSAASWFTTIVTAVAADGVATTRGAAVRASIDVHFSGFPVRSALVLLLVRSLLLRNSHGCMDPPTYPDQILSTKNGSVLLRKQSL